MIPSEENIGTDAAERIRQLSQDLSAATALMTNLLGHIGERMQCRGCHAEIYFVVHRNGRRTPYDPTGINHFITCPHAADFKKTKGPKDNA
jgi:hypothetical protein